MNPLIIYHSETGNTVEVAQVMATAIRADLKTAEKVAGADLQDRALVGLGSGIYNSSHMPEILRLVPTLPPCCRVFIFSTSGTAGWMGASLIVSPIGGCAGRCAAVRSSCSASGIARPGEGWYFRWFGLYRGRPSEADLSAAAQFALQMAEKAREITA